MALGKWKKSLGLNVINSLEVKRMSDFSELPEYTRDTYPSFGKKYNNEIGVISLTSWTARINTVAKTLFSLVQQCPNFHIVLVLAEEEFPKMTAELPENLMLFVENELIELMFVRKNYRSFKKILFTMDKYRDVPVISADDDCIYKYNYAEEFYNTWNKNKDCVISFQNSKRFSIDTTWGCATLYPPNYFKDFGIKYLTNDIIKIGLDDNYYIVLRKLFGMFKTKYVNKNARKFIKFHNENSPISINIHKNNYHDNCYSIYERLIKHEL